MLKVMTLNLNYYVDKHGSWPERRQLIREAIMQTNPDIVALQAVAKDPAVENGSNQVAQLSLLLPGYSYHYFQAATTYENGRQEGNGLLSRIPVAEFHHLRLSLKPDLEDTSQRIVLWTRFKLSSGPFYLFNAHFSWVGEQARENVLETLPSVQALSGPALIVGDLNTPPDSEVFEPFRQAGLQDCWPVLHPTDNRYTFESHQPFTRIDYAWANAALVKDLQAVEVVQKQKGETTRLSDHLGLIATFSVLC